MNRKKTIIICLILIILAALEGAAYFIWQKQYKDPAAVEEREKEERDSMYQQLLSTSLAEAKNYEWIVVINPTHGGSELGNTSGDLYEKDITLALAKQIQVKNTSSDIGIFLTRQTDTNPTLEQRNAFIEQIQPDLLIELHVNKDMQSSTMGTSIYYRTDYFHHKLTNVEFADMLEKNIVTAIEGKALGIFATDHERYNILTDKKMPAVSIECGYVTHKDEGLLLTRENYQDHFAQGVLSAFNEAIERLQSDKINDTAETNIK